MASKFEAPATVSSQARDSFLTNVNSVMRAVGGPCSFATNATEMRDARHWQRYQLTK